MWRCAPCSSPSVRGSPFPAAVPFTLQTFAVFTSCALLGGKRGCAAVALYMLLGAVGLRCSPALARAWACFSAPRGAISSALSLLALAMWGVEAKFGRGMAARVTGMALGLVLCYAFGTAWFMAVYTRANGPIALGAGAFHVRFPLYCAGLREDRPCGARLRAPCAAADQALSGRCRAGRKESHICRSTIRRNTGNSTCAQAPGLIRVPEMRFAAVRGQGDPNEEGGAYQRALSVLYALCYTLENEQTGRPQDRRLLRLRRAAPGRALVAGGRGDGRPFPTRTRFRGSP